MKKPMTKKEDKKLRERITQMTESMGLIMRDTKTRTVKEMFAKLSSDAELRAALGFDYKLFSAVIECGAISSGMVELFELSVAQEIKRASKKSRDTK